MHPANEIGRERAVGKVVPGARGVSGILRRRTERSLRADCHTSRSVVRDRAGRTPRAAKTATLSPVEDYTNKYKGEQVELALFGGEYQEGVLTAYCSIDDVPHVELNNHILVPLQNIASLHCSSRCDAPQGDDWPPRGLLDEDRDDNPEES
jgi:hypothetical protein